ncbi:unnamed protein product [Parnassius apollo]|uniref:(apollo) hypothetical protein n=1 Tax=Parnassius apollo TaxID=110799 RepID=A0A8S3YAK8_PARAO|nr:unnamed protein product [Parnassius apollo]
MKRNKAVYVTKGDLRKKIATKYNCCSNQAYGSARKHIATTKLDDTFRDYNLQNVSNWSHLTCSCNHSGRKYQETSYFTTMLKQMPSKSFNDIGVGSVKAFQKRKVKKIYLPETKERAVGTLDLSLYRNQKSKRFWSNNEFYHKTSVNSEESVDESNKKLLLNKKLSPLIRTKSNYTNPQNPLTQSDEDIKSKDSKSALDKLINAATQVDTEDIGKLQKMETFKERAVNTELFENNKINKSQIKPDANATVVNNKNENEIGSSLDSLLKHVHGLDKSYSGTLSETSVDPMENILEREYRKIFSERSRDCSCSNKLCKTNSDTLLRRFEALRDGVSSKEESKRNTSLLSRSLSDLFEPNYRDMSIVSDPPSLLSQSCINTKTTSPFSSNIYEKDIMKISHKKTLTNTKIENNSNCRHSDIEEERSDYQGIKGMFKLWSKKFSLEEGLYRKSKSKCTGSNKKSEGSIRSYSNKLLNSKSSEKKGGKRFRFFKKKSIQKDVMTGRCEVREGLNIKIGKASTPDYKSKAIRKIIEQNEDVLLKAWLQKFISKSNESKKSLVTRWGDNIYSGTSNSTEMPVNTSRTDTLSLIKNNTLTHSSHKENQKSLVNSSKQYIQAWMIPQIILDRLTRTKIYRNVKNDKYYINNKNKIDSITYLNEKTKVLLRDNNNCWKENFDSSSEYVMLNISLGYLNEFGYQSNVQYQSDEELYQVIDYETPLSSAIILRKKILNHNVGKGNLASNHMTNINRIKNVTNYRKKCKEIIRKKKRKCNGEIYQYDDIKVNRKCDSSGVGIIPGSDVKSVRNLVYFERPKIATDDESEETIYLVPEHYKITEIYLRDYCHSWIPLEVELDSWCISDSNIQKSLDNSLLNNSKTIPNRSDFRSIIISSCETSIKDLEKSEEKENTTIDIRVQPKDSVEVFKKRKLYHNGNKTKWKFDDPFPSSVSNSTNPLISNTPEDKQNKSNKKRVFISNDIPQIHSNEFKSSNAYEEESLKNSIILSPTKSENLQSIRREPYERINELPLFSSTDADCKLNTNHNLSNLDTENKNSTSTPLTLLIKSNQISPKNTETLKYSDLEIKSPQRVCSPQCSKYSVTILKSKADFNVAPPEIINDTCTKSESHSFESSKHSTIKSLFQKMRPKQHANIKSSEESLKTVKSAVKKIMITTDIQEISSSFETSILREDVTVSVPKVNSPKISKSKTKTPGVYFKKQPLKRKESTACSCTKKDDENKYVTRDYNDNKRKSQLESSANINVNTQEKESERLKEKEHKETNTSNLKDSKNSKICLISTTNSLKNTCNIIGSSTDLIEINFSVKCKKGGDTTMSVNVNDIRDSDIKDQNGKAHENNIKCNNSEHASQYVSDKNDMNDINIRILITNGKQQHDSKKNNLNRDEFPKIISDNFLPSTLIFNESKKHNSDTDHSLTDNFISLIEKNCHNKPTDETNEVESARILEENLRKIEIIRSYSSKEFFENSIQQRLKKKESNLDNSNFTNIITGPIVQNTSKNTTISNHKEHKMNVLQKIFVNAKDIKKNKKKLRNARKILQAILINSDRSNKKEIKKCTYNLSNQLNNTRLQSNFTADINQSHIFRHFGSVLRINEPSMININNYVYPTAKIPNKSNKSKRRTLILNSPDRNEKCFCKILAARLGLMDVRTCECQSLKTKLNNVSNRTQPMTLPNMEISDYNAINQNFISLHNNIKKNSEENHWKDCTLKPKYPDVKELLTEEQISRLKNTIKKVYSNYSQNICLDDYKIKNLNKNAIASLYNENKIILTNCNSAEEKCTNFHEYREKQTHCKYSKSKRDIFQLPEIKEAVLDMYALKGTTDNSDLLAVMPKFVCDVEKFFG